MNSLMFEWGGDSAKKEKARLEVCRNASFGERVTPDAVGIRGAGKLFQFEFGNIARNFTLYCFQLFSHLFNTIRVLGRQIASLAQII